MHSYICMYVRRAPRYYNKVPTEPLNGLFKLRHKRRAAGACIFCTYIGIKLYYWTFLFTIFFSSSPAVRTILELLFHHYRFLFSFKAIQMGLVYAQDVDGVNIHELSACGLANKLPYAFELSSILFFLAPWTLIVVLYILIGLKLYTSKRNSSRTTCSVHCRHTACLSSTNTRATGRVVKMLGEWRKLYLCMRV